MREKALKRLFVGYMMALYFPTMFAIMALTKAISEIVTISFDPELFFFTFVALPAILDLIALTVWFKLQFDYIPPFKNVFLAITIVGAIIVACDILSGSVKLHHLFIPSIFYMLSRTSRGSANFKAVSMLVTVFSMPFTIGYTAFSVILGVYYPQTILWLSMFLFFVWMNLRLKI